jgi:hypothetical protein
MGQDVLGAAAFYETDGEAGDGDLVQRCVQVCVAEDLIEILYRKIVGGTLELQDIVFPEDGGDVFVDDDIFGLFMTITSILKGSELS